MGNKRPRSLLNRDLVRLGAGSYLAVQVFATGLGTVHCYSIEPDWDYFGGPVLSTPVGYKPIQLPAFELDSTGALNMISSIVASSSS
jgi:hypothetical protein